MPKGRSGIFLLIFSIALVLILALLARQRGMLGTGGSQQPQILLELSKLMPGDWTALAEQPIACDLDNDGETEWLVLYQYDATETPNVYADRSGSVRHSPIGGVVYDTQVNPVPQELGTLSPYRPALLVPYKLLPDFYANKGQGYLGETKVEFYHYPSQRPGNAQKDCRAEELYFLGYSYLPLPTRLSIFRWEGRDVGYKGVHFIGDAHVDAPDIKQERASRVTKVTTYNRLANHRSVLCEVKVFERRGEPAALNFEPNPDQFSIDFCFGRPKDPVYPEAVLVALLRGGVPPKDQSPTGEDFRTGNAVVSSALLERLKTADRDPVQILSLTTQGAVIHDPGQATDCSAEKLQAPGQEKWWCSREQAYVAAVIRLNGEPRRVTARLISITNEKVTANVRWRVTELNLE